MEVKTKTRVATSLRKGDIGMKDFSTFGVAKSALTMYVERPHDELTLADFEVAALDRLTVLKGIETAMSRGLKSAELEAKIDKLLTTYLGTTGSAEDVRKDLVSHHILRLAFASTDDKRKWFVSHEVALFKHRLEKESPEQVANFMKNHGLNFEPISDVDRSSFVDDLQAVLNANPTKPADDKLPVGYVPTREDASTTQFFKVKWTQAMDLVSSRRVFLRGGFAFVPRDKLVSIIVNRYKSHLSYAMAMAFKALPSILRDERLRPMLTNMSTAYVGPQLVDGTGTGDKITPAQIPALAEACMPLCMRSMYRALAEDHHLKYTARQQFGLFIKGIGLTMEESLQFWQSEFTKRMSGEDFVKKYAYNVRHSYGKEGKRQDYTPSPCVRIVLSPPPGHGETHGCPFRNWSEAQIRSTLTKDGISSSAVDGIIAQSSTGNPQIACRKHFEARYPGVSSDPVGNHPNIYFNEAYKAMRAKMSTPVTATPVAAASSSGSDNPAPVTPPAAATANGSEPGPSEQ